MADQLTELRAWLKALWKQRGFSSMSAFAQAAGVSPTSYIAWVERGQRPKRAQLEKIADFVGADPDWALALAGYGPVAEPERETIAGIPVGTVEENDYGFRLRDRTLEDDVLRAERRAALDRAIAELVRLRDELGGSSRSAKGG